MLLRNQRTVLGIALTSLAAVMLTVPATAIADHEDRRSRSDHRDDDGRRDDARHADRGGDYRHSDGVWHDEYRNRYKAVAKRGHAVVRPAHRHHYANGHPPRHAAVHRKHGSFYYCEPCHHRFASRSGFDGHLRGHHHIAPWRLPFVVVHHTLGWVFFG